MRIHRLTVLSTSNVTTLNNRFAGFSVNYHSIRPRRFSVNEVALGFINALKGQAIENCNQYITSYTYTDTEYENDPIRIRINAAAGSPDGQLVRCNYMFAIKTLMIDLMTQVRGLYGARFTLSYRSRLLYIGVFDNKNDAPSLAQSSNSSTDPSEPVAEEKRALSIQTLDISNSTATLLAIPGSNNVEYRINFDFRGNSFSKISLFSAIVEFMMTLAQLDSGDTVENISQTTPTDSLMIFVMHNATSSAPLQGFQLLAILESIARHAVNNERYQEMIFDFFISGELVAWGCVTTPHWSRMWCQGLREGGSGGQQPLVGNFSSSGSDLIQS